MRTRNVVIVTVLVGVAAAGLVLAAVVGGIVWLGYRMTNDPTLEEFAKVQPGMTYEQVVKMMDRAPRDQRQLPDGTLACRWSHTEDTQYVTVIFRNGVAVLKSSPAGDLPASAERPSTAPTIAATRPG